MFVRRAPIRAVLLGGLVALLAVSTSVHAQDAEQRAAAAEAYDRASGFYIQRNWEQAARWFETAHRLAPSAPALVQAARAHERADNDLRAATLALRLQALYPQDRAATRTARGIIAQAERRFLRVDVECEEQCRVELDGTLVDHPSFFVEPGSEHTVAAHFETGDRTETVSGDAGETQTLELTAPPPGEAPEDPTEGLVDSDPEETEETTTTTAEPDGGGLPPAAFFVAAALTVAAGGVTIWSGLDTLDGVDAYEEEAMSGDPAVAREMLSDGQDRELRTNILIAGTAALGALSIVLLLATDWSAGDVESEDASVGLRLDLGSERAGASLRGRF